MYSALMSTLFQALVNISSSSQIAGDARQAHAKIPSDAWEYHIRKALNDAAYNGLEYVPYCSTMPVQEQTASPQFMWVSKNKTDDRGS